ncbi:MAG: hypothetical protein AB7V42_02745 [Thermoleophilia bacterium]
MERAPLRPAAALALLLTAAAAPATAAIETAHDSQGRTITFDVQAPGADVAGYAAILDRTLHGAEISSVTVTIVPQARIATECGAGAAACYRWSSRGGAVMFVPDLPPERVGAALVHEYGHHVDNVHPHIAGAPGLDGTAGWWRARNIAALLAAGEVAWDYGKGWDRSIAEIFAEDFTATNLPQYGGLIGWLGAPPAAVQQAIRADLGDAPVTPPATGPGTVSPPQPPGASQPVATPPATGTEPVPSGAFARSRFRVVGRLADRGHTGIAFPVAATRRVSVRLGGVRRGLVRATLRCPGMARARSITAAPRRAATLVAPRVAPGTCRLTVRALGRSTPFGLLIRKTAVR